MVTLAYLKQLDQEVRDAANELTKRVQKAQLHGLVVEIDSVEIIMVGTPSFTQFKATVGAPMDLLESLES